MTATAIKKIWKKWIVWGWIITLPIVVIGGTIIWRTWQQYEVYFVRYNSAPFAVHLNALLNYQTKMAKEQVGSLFTTNYKSKLPVVNLSIDRSSSYQLNKHMPQSGFEYVKANMGYGGGNQEVKFRYRGDYLYHWAYEKKSIRIKTKKNKLFDGIRVFNFQAPKFADQLNNYLGYQLAESMGLLGPKTSLVRLAINGKDNGIYIFVEQISELTLRRNNKMPGDIYRGEMVAKDKFIGVRAGTNLFDHAGFWDKVAVNNHYPEADSKPLESLIHYITTRDQERLSEMLDFEAWGKFSAYLSLASTFHFHRDHNWRIYYDPWTQKMIPIVWDPVGWVKGWREPTNSFAFNPVIQTELEKLLFKNGDFLRSRDNALAEFHKSGKSAAFLSFKDETVSTLMAEIRTDKNLLALTKSLPDTEAAIYALSSYVDRVFSDSETVLNGLQSRLFYSNISGGLRLSVKGPGTVKKIKLDYLGEINQKANPRIQYTIRTKNSAKAVQKAPSNVFWSNSELIIDTSIISNSVLKQPGSLTYAAGYGLDYLPATYDIQTGVDNKLLAVWADWGNGWKRVDEAASLDRVALSGIYAPVANQKPEKQVIWSGVKKFSGTNIFENQIVIEPGTKIVLQSEANLIFKNKVHAMGQPELPILFEREAASNAPWGTIALQGQGANGSYFSHCSFDGGSGYKGELFEYSGMFSVHHVNDLVIDKCRFENGTVVDDMVHIVYSSAKILGSTFKKSYSDALDIDISSVEISNSLFESSGNDALDLMSSFVTVDNSKFISSGDKGISVGENSQLLAINNVFELNQIGVQSKDNSKAFLYNQTFSRNTLALNAYKKNWQYGNGGEIFVFKSQLKQNNKNLKSGKKSNIFVYDTYSDLVPKKNKRIQVLFTDNERIDEAEQPKILIPSGFNWKKSNSSLLNKFSQAKLNMRDTSRRGALQNAL